MRVKSTEYALEQVLICACCEISVNGWVSAKDAEAASAGRAGVLVSTKEKVRLLLQTDLESGKAARKALMSAAKEKGLDLFGDSIKDEVHAATKWASNLMVNMPMPVMGMVAGTRLTDYDTVVSHMAMMGKVDPKKLGFAVSIIPSYRRQKNHPKFTSEWVGALRERIECVVVVASIKNSTPPGQWWLVTMKNGDGNVLKWFTKDQPIVGVDAQIRIKGNVVAHEDWKGFKSTKLNRVTII